MNKNNYEVGYGKPPKSGQFKPGQSGNAKGRPNKARNRAPEATGVDVQDQPLAKLIREEAYRGINIRTEDGKTEKMPAVQAVLRSMGLNGIKGNRMAASNFLGIALNLEESQRQQKVETMREVVEYKAACEKADQDAADNGKPAPTHLPHPDDILVDTATGFVSIVGPVNKEDDAKMRNTLVQRDAMIDQIEIIREEFGAAPSQAEIEDLQRQVDASMRVLKILNRLLPPRLQISLEESDSA